MLHKNPEIILPETFSLLEKICADPFFDNFNLVGGTALALQIGHRFSIDLDFFSPSSFGSARIIDHLVQNYDFNLKRRRFDAARDAVCDWSINHDVTSKFKTQ